MLNMKKHSGAQRKLNNWPMLQIATCDIDSLISNNRLVQISEKKLLGVQGI